MDVWIPVRHTRPDPDPLRWALRAIEASVPHERVFVVGGSIPWLSDHAVHLWTPQQQRKFIHIGTNLLAYATHPDRAERVLLSNDDIFAMTPIPDIDRPRAHGLVDARVDAMLERRPHDVYTAGLASQRDILRSWGYDTATLPMLDGQHHPLVVDTAALLDLLLRVSEEFPAHPLGHYKMLLATIVDLEQVVEVPNSKVKGPGLPDRPVVSMSPTPWRGLLGEKVRDHFPDMCRYEL